MRYCHACARQKVHLIGFDDVKDTCRQQKYLLILGSGTGQASDPMDLT
jgi:hypothetical protein